ncbi:mini-chromosome maintenance complex-binding protein [Haematobia irritans]|uniref:mini-chromosome maintenance complex-binding protein n=1 Tax=Haematobia irritans TaxID=7368 RepID=UPI003F503CC5
MLVKNEIAETKLPSTPEEFVGPKNEEFCKWLKDPNLWSTIPLLNYTPLHELKDYSVVRFRGMIQDMLDPEIYLETYEVKKCGSATEPRIQQGKYRDCLVLGNDEEVNYHANANIQGERRVLFVVSIPGINDWARNYEEMSNKCNVPEVYQRTSSETSAKKRSAPDEEMETECDKVETISDGIVDVHKRQKVDTDSALSKPSSSSNQACLGAEYLLNSPIPSRPSKACMVKVYSDFDTFTLNTVIDVVGFLSVDPALDGTTMEVDYDNASELQALNPPPSLIPRLHAIAVHQLPHSNPLLDMRFGRQGYNDEMDNMNLLSVQKELKTLLKLCLFNDDLAAEYMISHLISTVYSRCELRSIGKFSLNVCNLPKDIVADYTKQLYGILEQILPASHYLPMTLDTMNTAAFVPKKDYETNKLISGLLQLAPHTHLVLDETCMQQGKLEASGVLAIQSVANLINNQQIKCNFQYYEIDYNVDIPILILSEGRSMLPSDISLPLKTDDESRDLIMETLKAANHYLSQNSRLEQFRRYLTNAKMSTFTLNPDDTEMIQNDFVEMRKIDAVVSADDLHSLLVLSRLLAIARGKEIMDKESWELAKEMESKRRQRLAALPKSNLKVRHQ